MRFALSIAILFSLVAPALLRADEQFPRASVSTTGESVIWVKPDEVIVNFGVETFDPSLDKAKQQNDAASAKLVKAVRDLGIDEKYIQIDSLSVDLRYNENGHPVRGVEGYYTRRFYCVTLKDVKLTDKLVDTILKNGANHLSGLEFRTTELRKHRDAARNLALRAAKEKAEALAGALGVGVGAPRSITEGAFYGGSFNDQRYFGNAGQNGAQAAPAGEAGGEEGATPLGQIAIRATVSVVFDLK